MDTFIIVSFLCAFIIISFVLLGKQRHQIKSEQYKSLIKQVKEKYPRFFIDSMWSLSHCDNDSKNTYKLLTESDVTSANLRHSDGFYAYHYFELHCNDLLRLESTFSELSDTTRYVMLDYLYEIRENLMSKYLNEVIPQIRREKLEKLKSV